MGKLGQKPGLELIRVIHRQLGHHVECALGLLAHHAGYLHQLFVNGITAALVFLTHGGKVIRIHGIQGSGGYLIQSSHRKAGLTALEHLLLQLLVLGDEYAYAGAAGAESLGYRVYNYGVFRNILKLGDGIQRYLSVVYEFTIYLVADEEQVVGLGDIRKGAHLFFGKDNARGVAGVGKHDGPGVGGYKGLYPFPVNILVALFGGGVEGHYAAAGEVYEGAVIGIERLGYDYLVAVVQYAVEHYLQCLGTAGGYGYIAVFKLYAYAGIVFLYRVYQYGKAGRRGVFKHGQGKIAHRFKVGGRGLDIGLADIQMVDLYAFFIALQLVWVEFANGRKAALVDLVGKLHLKYASCYLSCPLKHEGLKAQKCKSRGLLRLPGYNYNMEFLPNKGRRRENVKYDRKMLLE